MKLEEKAIFYGLFFQAGFIVPNKENQTKEKILEAFLNVPQEKRTIKTNEYIKLLSK